jgi:hypothetical protein
MKEKTLVDIFTKLVEFWDKMSWKEGQKLKSRTDFVQNPKVIFYEYYVLLNSQTFVRLLILMLNLGVMIKNLKYKFFFWKIQKIVKIQKSFKVLQDTTFIEKHFWNLCETQFWIQFLASLSEYFIWKLKYFRKYVHQSVIFLV